MNPEPPIPPLRDLPAGRLETLESHLLTEIAHEQQPRIRLSGVYWTRPRLAGVASACAAAAAAVAFAVISLTGQSGSAASFGFHASLAPISGQKGPTHVHPFSFGPSTAGFVSHDCQPLGILLVLPPDFNPATASDSQLTEYGFPPRPHGASSDPAFKAARRRWLKIAEGAKRNPICGIMGRAQPQSTYAASLASLRRLALRLARLSGDPIPTSAEWLRTTRQLAVSSQSAVRVKRGHTPVYFVVLRGGFVAKSALFSGWGREARAASAPRFTVLTFTADVGNGDVLDLSLSDRIPDYSAIGMPHRFRLESLTRRS